MHSDAQDTRAIHSPVRRSDLLDNGILLKQSKTGKTQIKRWTNRLRTAIGLAKEQRGKAASMYVLHNPDGHPYTSSAFDDAFQKAKKAAALKYEIATDFTFHDLKAKGTSDYEGDKQRFSGHKTAAQVAVYDRKIDVVDPVE